MIVGAPTSGVKDHATYPAFWGVWKWFAICTIKLVSWIVGWNEATGFVPPVCQTGKIHITAAAAFVQPDDGRAEAAGRPPCNLVHRRLEGTRHPPPRWTVNMQR